MTKYIRSSLALIAALVLSSGSVFADPMTPTTCASDERKASMDSAENCWMGLGNPKDNPELQSHMPGDEWMDVGHLDNGALAHGFLSFVFESGGYDQSAFSGEWTIADAFWDMYSEAIITIHVGNGGGDPDYFAFLITKDDTSGFLEYMKTAGGGGGFSNMVLWGRGSVSVPEPGTLLLMGSGLLLLAGSRRRKRKNH